jgi:RNA polymerase sigma-B factor
MDERSQQNLESNDQDKERAEERALFARYKAAAGEPEAQGLEDRLVQQYQPLVYKIVHKFRGHAEHFDDLVQVGSVGLLLAIRRFDLEQGFRFSTYAWQTIQGEIQRYFRDKTWAVNVPRDLKERSLKVFNVINEHLAATGHDPTVTELVERTGMSEEAVQEALELGSAYHPQSFMDNTRESDSGYAAMDESDGGGGGSSEQLDMSGTKRSIFWESLLKQLEATEARVIRMYHFEDLTQKEIADRMGTSQMNVSRIMKKAYSRLRTMLAPSDFEGL